MASLRKLPSIDNRAQPSQARSSDTFELIVLSTAQLVQEIGFDKLSTNKICDKAGLTPPALYRYFPNKYAILRELGERLMKLQDDIVIGYGKSYELPEGSFDDQVEYYMKLNSLVFEATQSFPGSVGIMRALRAVPALRSIRLQSREHVVDANASELQAVFPHQPLDMLKMICRLTTEWGYTVLEMAVEEPDCDREQMLLVLARGCALYYQSLHQGAPQT